MPKLDAFSLAEIAKATGLSLAACSRFRAGVRVPDPRHWSALLALTSNASNVRWEGRELRPGKEPSTV